MTKSLMAGIDLHSNNAMIAIVDEDGWRLQHKKVDCELDEVVKFLSLWKEQLKSVAVESTFNWYWLVDGLRALSYPVVLANPAKIEQYSGIKHADDKNDAYFLAELQRLNILPTGYIYDPQLRPVRDLLRRRMLLVHQRTALMLSFKSLYSRTTGAEMTLKRLKELSVEQCRDLYEHLANQLIATVQKEHIKSLTHSIEKIEQAVLKCAREVPYYPKLKTEGPVMGSHLYILQLLTESKQNVECRDATPRCSAGAIFISMGSSLTQRVMGSHRYILQLLTESKAKCRM